MKWSLKKKPKINTVEKTLPIKHKKLQRLNINMSLIEPSKSELMDNEKEKDILSLLNKFKKSKEISLDEKMEIFMYVYNLPINEKPNNLNKMIDIILDEFGEGFTFSDEYDKQSFLNIYGEPKNNYLLLNKTEDVLDIVLGELALRDDITPIFPSEKTNREPLSPYTKENSIDFLAMKKLNIYSSSSFELNRLINNMPHSDFPLTEDLFEDLSWIDEFNKISEPVFYLLKKAHKSSRHIRVFIKWFNSHFWKEYLGQIELEHDEKLFNSLLLVFKKYAKVRLTINETHLKVSNSKPILILGGNELNQIGQLYFKTLYPFSTVEENKILFE